MKGSKRTRRNVLLMGFAFALTAVLIALARLTPRAGIPPEPPELAARRADRQNNGFYLLEQLLADVADRPPGAWLPLPEDPVAEGYYQPAEGSLGDWLQVKRPEDDPLLLEYANSAQGMVPRVREILAKPDMLLPPDDSVPEDKRFLPPFDREESRRLENLLRLLIVQANRFSASPETTAESAQLLRDILELVLRMHEGSVQSFTYIIDDPLLAVLPRLQPQQQRELLEWALPLRRVTARRNKVEFDLRRHMALLDSMRKQGSVLRPIEAIEYVRARSLFIHHLDFAYQAAEMRLHEYSQRLDNDPIFNQLIRAGSGFRYNSYVYFNSYWAHRMDFIAIILAIELYRDDHGQFPAALQDLVPGYLAEIPEDALREPGAQYVYERIDNGYRLTTHHDYHDKFERRLAENEK